MSKFNQQQRTKSSAACKKDAQLKSKGTIFIQLGLILSILVCYFAFEMRHEVIERQVNVLPDITGEDVEVVMDKFIIEKEIAKVEPKVIPQEPKVDLTDIIDIVDNNTDLVDTVIPSTETEVEQPQVTDTDLGQIFKEDEPVVETNLLSVQIAPIFPGCEGGSQDDQRACLQSKIQKHFGRKFDSDIAVDNGYKKKVVINVEVTIQEDGEVIVKNLRAPDADLEREVRRVVAKLPRFSPGKIDGRPVRVTYGFPVRIDIQD